MPWGKKRFAPGSLLRWGGCHLEEDGKQQKEALELFDVAYDEFIDMWENNVGAIKDFGKVITDLREGENADLTTRAMSTLGDITKCIGIRVKTMMQMNHLYADTMRSVIFGAAPPQAEQQLEQQGKESDTNDQILWLECVRDLCDALFNTVPAVTMFSRWIKLVRSIQTIRDSDNPKDEAQLLHWVDVWKTVKKLRYVPRINAQALPAVERQPL